MKSSPPIVLIVDDIAANRQTLIELLAVRDYQLVEASTGTQALALAAATQPDLVLLDVMMPGMDGYEVCRRLRADSRLAEMPVVMITALDDQASRLAGIEAGADDFIAKPFNRAELRARVHTITRLNRYRRHTEAVAALLESETRFRTLAEQSEEVFWFTSRTPVRLTYVSPAAEKIWGVSPQRFLEDESYWAKSIHRDDQVRVSAAREATLAGRAARFKEEYRVIRPDGTERWILDSGTPIRGEDGAIVSMGGVARDVTDGKAAEELMLRAQRLENIGMLAAGIAHDFNNALAPIVMCCSILRPHVADASGQRLLDTMEKGAARSVALVRQLLSFAHGANGQRQLLQTRHVLRELVELAEVTFPKSIEVVSQLPGDLWPVVANATQIHQVFLNLCVNARDAMPAGGVLCVTGTNRTLDATAAANIPDARPGNFLAVEIRDTGTGIPAHVLPRIWEPFYTTKGEGKGTGLGLSTVRGIVHQHGGFAAIETHPDHGTAFTIYLPAGEGIDHGEALQQDAPPARGNGELILVVDDEEPVRTTAAEILGGYGYQTLTACDGAEAIAIFAPRAGEVRLVLTDQHMPLLGSAGLLTALHRIKPGVPVIEMSGFNGGESPSRSPFSTAFLAKPFQAETLLSIVRSALDTNQPSAVEATV